jgi:threonine dehydratase
MVRKERAMKKTAHGVAPVACDAGRLTLPLIQSARLRIAEHIHCTPLLASRTLDAFAGAQLFFKCENLQKTGAFKARGATNAVLLLSDEQARRGVVTHSSGNHAAALARAAQLRAITAHIVMPNNAPRAKQASVRRYGGNIIFCEPNLQSRERTASEVMARTGAELIHPYNDLRVMAGQGTTALELMEQLPDLDLILCPVGGGGHISGIAVAAKNLNPSIQVMGVEPAGADDAQRSFKAGRILSCDNPNTIADGLRSSLGELPFAEIRHYVDGILTASDEAIVQAMRLIWEVMKVIVEPSGAVAYAALLEGKVATRFRRIALVLTGGNLDLDYLPWIPAGAR